MAQSSGLRLRSQGLAIAIVGLLLVLYLPVIVHWYDGWIRKTISIEHEYYSHGILGLPIAAGLAGQHRQRWEDLSDRANPLGLVLLLLGVWLYLSGLSTGVNLSLPLVLTGLVLWLKGVAGLQLQAFPLVLLVLATPTPIPYLLVPYTLPLQQFIATSSGFLLMQMGMDVRVEQIYLIVNQGINQGIVEIAPYCAGLKMLFTCLYAGLLLLHWTGTWTSRTSVLLFFGGIVGLSTTANVVRNTLLAFFHGTGQQAMFYWLHDSWGGDLYSTVLLLCLVLLLRSIQWLREQFATWVARAQQT